MRNRGTWFIAAALLAYAAPATAVDFMGYFRDGFTLNGKGGGATCFKTPGMDYKLRLGNECDSYGEWGLQQTIYKDKSGVEFTAGVMFNYDQDVATPNGTSVPFGIQQNYFKAKFPQLGNATFWGGKQYYRRENIDMIDFFYLNTSDTGAGVEDVDLGFGKLAFSVFAAKGPTYDRTYVRPDLRVYGIPLNPGGTIMIDVNVASISRNTDADPKGANDASAGFWVTAEHHQDGILGGWNTFTAQFANANAANMGGATPGFSLNGGKTDADKAQQASDAINKNNQQFRVLDQLLLQPSGKFQILVGGVYQLKQFASNGTIGDTTKTKVTQVGVFTRPVVYLSDYFKIQGDLGYTSSKTEHQDALNLVKGTIAPTLTPAVGDGGGFFVRPEFRVFVTYASWNDATNTVNPAGGASTQVNFGAGKTSGVTYGAQVEGWF
jgi:maltoporin